MKTSKDIFKSDRYARSRFPEISGVQFFTILLSVISLIAAIYIIVNFKSITMGIAVAAVGILSSGFPVLLVIIGIFIFFESLRWRMRRRFWGW